MEQLRNLLQIEDQRTRLVVGLAGLVGLRPGEIFALQRQDVSGDRLKIVRRIYQGQVDTPKSRRSTRTVGLPPRLRSWLEDWIQFVGPEPAAWVFFSENRARPISDANFSRRNLKPAAQALGLTVNFQILRRTCATLAREINIDLKGQSDQLGHNVGVNLDEYTQTPAERRVANATTPEDAIFGRQWSTGVRGNPESRP